MIPTLNRPQAIVDIVRDVQRQDYPDFEMLVVGPDVARLDELQALAREDKRIKIIPSDQSGTCHSRNLGVKAARGSVMIFLDDDCRIESSGFLQAHAANYADDSIGGVGGRVIDRNTKLNKPSRGAVCTVSRTGAISPNSLGTSRQHINAPRGGNMSFRTDIIRHVGGFDERFRGNAMREETDFSLRVVEGGWTIVFDPTAEVIHLALPGGTRSMDRITWYEDFFFNEGLFFLKHFPAWMFPILLWRKLRPMFACATYYGHLRPRALRAPFAAFRQAWHTAHETSPVYV